MVPMPELPVIKTKSLKRSSGAKTNKTSHKYGNISGIVKKIMSVIEISSKIYEPKIYEETITDPIYSR